MASEMMLPPDHPVMQAWKEWTQTEQYANAKRWLAEGGPSDSDGELWAAFLAGWSAATPQQEPEEAGAFFREWRVGRGLSLRETAAMLGVAPVRLAEFERGVQQEPEGDGITSHADGTVVAVHRIGGNRFVTVEDFQAACDFLRARVQPRRVSDWRPIETAPRDGTKFLATNGTEYSDARWPIRHACGRWEKNEEGEWRGAAIWPRPTHWIPLPEPPITPGEENDDG